MNKFIVTHVGPGETLSEIAARYGVSVDALQRWNRIENPDLVLAGQRIVVYTATNAPDSSASESVVSQTVPGPDVGNASWDAWIGGAIVLGLLLFLLRRKRGSSRPVSVSPSPHQPSNRTAESRIDAIGRSNSVADPLPSPQVNDGERLVSSELMRHYRDWILIDNIMLPSGRGTTQIDHILVSPDAVFLIETKDMNGWVFGSPGQEEWTQSFAAGHRSRKAGIKSKQFKFYNPLLQNEGHARALVKLGIINRWRLRPIVIFVGDAQFKTGDKFLPYEEHEKIARRNGKWRMRGVICMSLADLHRYIEFSVSSSSKPGMARQKMEAICNKIRAIEIPVTAENHAKHVDFVRSVKDMD